MTYRPVLTLPQKSPADAARENAARVSRLNLRERLPERLEPRTEAGFRMHTQWTDVSTDGGIP